MYAVDATSGEWKLSGPSNHPITIAEPLHFVHIQFNLVGHELAAIDNLGHSHIYSQLGGIGRMQAGSSIAQEDESQHTELDAIAGLHWLPIFPLDCRVCLGNNLFRSFVLIQPSVTIHRSGEQRLAWLDLSIKTSGARCCQSTPSR